MEVLIIIDEMERMVEKSLHIPLTGRVFLDGDALLDHLDRLRTKLPEEMRQAQWIRQERERLLEEARIKAQNLIEEAEKRAEEMARENEVVRKAKANASEVLAKTNSIAEEIKAGAYSYAGSILIQVEKNLEQALARVRQDRQVLQSMPPGTTPVKEAAVASPEKK